LFVDFIGKEKADLRATRPPSDVLALWSNEGSLKSDFGPPGPKGEIGPIQIRPGVITEEGKAGILPPNYNSNVTANLTAGALYYSRLMSHYGVPANQAAAAYNGGPYSYANKAAQNYQNSFNYRTDLYMALIICMSR
jgi:soluble lytic murein transglycosylase-like protein